MTFLLSKNIPLDPSRIVLIFCTLRLVPLTKFPLIVEAAFVVEGVATKDV